MRLPALSGVSSPSHTPFLLAQHQFCRLSPFLCLPLLANRSYSSGTTEVATKTVTSWSNALDAPNKDQRGLRDVGAPRYDQCGPLDAPNDNQCAPNEPGIASPEASATVRIGITRTIALSAHLESMRLAPQTPVSRALFLIAHA